MATAPEGCEFKGMQGKAGGEQRLQQQPSFQKERQQRNQQLRKRQLNSGSKKPAAAKK